MLPAHYRYTNEDIRKRFAHHAPADQKTVDAHVRVRELLAEAAVELNELLQNTPEKDRAIDALELARMHAQQAIAYYGPMPKRAGC